jgi:hypothetical protein
LCIGGGGGVGSSMEVDYLGFMKKG